MKKFCVAKELYLHMNRAVVLMLCEAATAASFAPSNAAATLRGAYQSTPAAAKRIPFYMMADGADGGGGKPGGESGGTPVQIHGITTYRCCDLRMTIWI